MFDKFGEFDSYEELNKAAEGLLKEGDLDSLRVLAAENGLDKEEVEDYIEGMIPELTTIYTAAFGRLAIEQKEIDKMKSLVERMPLQVILDMLKGMATEESVAAAVVKKGKRVSDIYEAMRGEAQKHKSGSMGVSCGTDRQLCEIIKAYYTRDDFKKKIEDLYK
ncbi:MAG: hypothetical protein ACOCNL_05845 [Acetivibrio ethanolgignens]